MESRFINMSSDSKHTFWDHRLEFSSIFNDLGEFSEIEEFNTEAMFQLSMMHYKIKYSSVSHDVFCFINQRSVTTLF